MEVLVTGAAGFIGSNFVHRAAAKHPEWNITALDSLTYAGNLRNLESLLGSSRVSFLKADITDWPAMEQLFKGKKFDLVFHLAAESHVDRSLYGPNDFVRTNVLGTQHLITAIVQSGHKGVRFVHISTDEVYGSLGPTGFFVETTPLDPTSPYAASKAASDLMVLAAGKTYNLDVVITRCTNNFGPYQFPEKFIPLFVTNAIQDKKLPLYGDGMNVRSWLHVDDHADGILLAAAKGKSGEVYNFGGSGEAERPNREVAEVILEILGKDSSLIQYVGDRPAHDRRYAVDSAKAERELGWKAAIPFREGLRATVEWYRSNTAWWQEVTSGEYRRFYDQHYATLGLKAAQG
jgi:dTDP-glucose 4,6-dehydratase